MPPPSHPSPDPRTPNGDSAAPLATPKGEPPPADPTASPPPAAPAPADPLATPSPFLMDLSVDGFDVSTLASVIADQGLGIATDFLPPAVLADLIATSRELWEQGLLRPAGVGRGANWQLRPEIRGDHVLWLDTLDSPPALLDYFARLDALRIDLNRQLYLGLHEYEGHLAVYPPGAGYRRHLDRFRDAPNRRVTVILYLNPDWTEADGGQLRIYLDPVPPEEARVATDAGAARPLLDPPPPPEALADPATAAAVVADALPRYLDVTPTAGTLVVFLSDSFYHEVLPAIRPRTSITGWYRLRGDSPF